MNKPKFVYVTYIATTPEKLWEALTNGEFTRQFWWGRRVRAEWKTGGRLEMVQQNGDLDFCGEILACDPPRRLSYTFDVQSLNFKKEGETPSRVTYEISTEGANVKLVVTHDELDPQGKVFEGISQGWPELLSSMKSLLETGAALSYGDEF
jgi:uncharacterized protein YndB with AHSA1/START domain